MRAVGGKKDRPTKAAVKKAMKEFRTLGLERVHKIYGFRDSLMYDVVDPDHPRTRYPSKAIDGIAFRYVGDRKALRSTDFFGGTEAINPLKELGFKIRRKTAEGYEPTELSMPLTRDSDKLAYRAIRIRQGQQKFRKNLLRAYDNKCAISGAKTLEILDAAHIRHHSKEGESAINNGIILRTDLHTLFDEQLLKINPRSLKVSIDRSVRDSEYRNLQGRKIFQPKTEASRINTDYLSERWSNN
jgi:hypothetical protein